MLPVQALNAVTVTTLTAWLGAVVPAAGPSSATFTY
jgi:hypothetical protein